jgi:hypothetical protein
LAASFGDVRAEYPVIDTAARLSVDKRFDSLDTRGRQGPPRDNNRFPGDEDCATIGLVEPADDTARLESVIVDFK